MMGLVFVCNLVGFKLSRSNNVLVIIRLKLMLKFLNRINNFLNLTFSCLEIRTNMSNSDLPQDT